MNILMAVSRFLILAVLWGSVVSAAEPVQIEFRFSTIDRNPPRNFQKPGFPKLPLEIIQLDFKVAGHENKAEVRLSGGDFDPGQPSSYRLIVTEKGKAPREIPILAVDPRGPHVRAGRAAEILLLPKELPKQTQGAEFKIELAHTLTFDLPTQSEVQIPPNTFALDAKALETNRKYTAPLSTENKIEVLNGTGGGQASLHYHVRQNQIKTGDWLHVDLDVKADVSLASDDKHRYFDSIVAEFDAFRAYNFGRGSADEQGHAEFGLASRFESDRDFANMNVTAGLAYQVYFKNRVTTGLHHLVAKDELGVAPLFVFAYDYVGHISQSDETPDTGDQRLRAGFYWSLPLFREVRVPFLDVADGDFLIAAEALYDVEQGILTDNTKLTLDLRQHTEKKDGWSYNVTYARGRATPTYKNFDALLFGIKKWF
jgi:hypothetical protein